MQRIFAKKTPTTCSYCPFVDSFVYGFFSCSQANRRGIQPFYDALRETVIRCAVEGDSFGITNFVHRTPSPSTRPEPATSCTAARLFFIGVFSPRDSGHHDASLVQVRDKTEPSRRSLSFSPNFKLSHALNHRQFDSHQASARQSWMSSTTMMHPRCK